MEGRQGGTTECLRCCLVPAWVLSNVCAACFCGGFENWKGLVVTGWLFLHDPVYLCCGEVFV